MNGRFGEKKNRDEILKQDREYYIQNFGNKLGEEIFIYQRDLGEILGEIQILKTEMEKNPKERAIQMIQNLKILKNPAILQNIRTRFHQAMTEKNLTQEGEIVLEGIFPKIRNTERQFLAQSFEEIQKRQEKGKEINDALTERIQNIVYFAREILKENMYTSKSVKEQGEHTLYLQ